MAGDIESRMNFIIEQQAQFTADIQILKEREAEILRVVGQLADVSVTLAHHAQEVDRRFEETDRRFKETDRLIRELRDSQRELVDGQTQTDRRLNALIDVVDKMARGNGQKPPSG